MGRLFQSKCSDNQVWADLENLFSLIVTRDRSFFTKWGGGGLVGFGGVTQKKKRIKRGGHPKKTEGGGGSREIF